MSSSRSPAWPKGVWPKVVGQGQGFGQILIEPHDTGNGPCHLGYLNGMGEPGAVMVALVIHKNLGFMLQAAEGGGMDDAVPVPLEGRARRAFSLREQPSPALLRPGRIACRMTFHLTAPLTISCPRPT